ncbi:MAG: hypothetical protein ACJAZ2_001220 [Glaciecola sp.]|jgi:hypothetical protein
MIQGNPLLILTFSSTKTYMTMTARLLLCLIVCPFLTVKAQSFIQYFEEMPTTYDDTLHINIDETSENIWQIGQPNKPIFYSAASVPNALVTDTINNYPLDNTSTFWFKPIEKLEYYGYNVIAIQWMQKLDLSAGHHGFVEFSSDGGQTYQSIFDNSYVYNLYGYENSSLDTLNDGKIGFSGTDTTWRNIWVCYDANYLQNIDTLILKYTFDSHDSNSGAKQVLAGEGWMLDNFRSSITIAHTAKEVLMESYQEVYPNPSSGKINIRTQKQKGYHIIENMSLFNNAGTLIREYGVSPTKFNIDISDFSDGTYFLEIKTNVKTSRHKVILKK